MKKLTNQKIVKSVITTIFRNGFKFNSKVCNDCNSRIFLFFSWKIVIKIFEFFFHFQLFKKDNFVFDIS